MRVHADVDVPENIGVSWTSGAAGLTEATASLCGTGSPACANTRLDATGVFGPAGGPPDLFTPPTLPVRHPPKILGYRFLRPSRSLPSRD